MSLENLLEANVENQKKDLKRAEELLQQAKPKVEMNNFDNATILALKEAMELFEKWEVKEKMAEVYEEWGYYHYNHERYAKAIDFFQRSKGLRLELFGELHEDIWRLSKNLGICFSYLHDFEVSKTHKLKALNLAKSIFGEHHLNTVDSYSKIGVWYFDQDQYSTAIEYFQLCLTIATDLSPTPKKVLGSIYSNLSVNYSSIGNYEKAVFFSDKGLKLYRETRPSMHIDLAVAYHNYAVLMTNMGNWEGAVLFAQKAIDIFSYNNSMQVIFPYKHLMTVYRQQKAYEKGIEVGKKIQELIAQGNSKPHRAAIYACFEISNCYQKLKRYEEALFSLEKATQIAADIYGRNHAVFADCMHDFGKHYVEVNALDKAEEYLQKSLQILQSCESSISRFVQMWSTFGALYEKRKDFLSAITAYHQQLLVSIEGYEEKDIYDCPRFDMKIGGFRVQSSYKYWVLIFLKKAHSFYQYYSLNTKDLKDLDASFRTYQVAFHFLDQIRQSFQSQNFKLNVVKFLHTHLVKAVFVSHAIFEISQNPVYLHHAFAFSEKNKGNLMLINKQEKMAKQAAKLPQELLETEQRIQMKLASLQKNIQSQKQKGEKTEKAVAVLQKLEADYFNAYHEFNSFKKQLQANYPDYYRQKYSTETVSIEALQSALSENQTVLSYFIGEEKIYLFAITSDEYEVFAMHKPDNWEGLIQRYLQSIKFDQKETFQQLSFELYQILLQEAIDYLIDPFEEDPKQVFIIPHAELHYLPFESLLIAEAATSMPYKDLDYLLKHCQVSYHYSATLLHLDLQKQNEATAEVAPADISFTGFAPVYESTSSSQKQAIEQLQSEGYEYVTAVNRSEAVRSDGTWLPLPYSKIEVETIQQLFEEQGHKSQSFLYEEANKINLEQQIGKSRFVLIAAHGIVNDEYPELSGLVLAGNGGRKTMEGLSEQEFGVSEESLDLVTNSPSFDSPFGGGKGEVSGDIRNGNGNGNRNEEKNTLQDCLLNMKEVAMIPMSADLVVLSSCESGIGELHKGEGMMAVNRGFLASGAKNVVSTLFKVNDKASSELTTLMFAHILQGELFATALQKAKLELLEKRENISPKMWSGFVLFGKGG